MRLVVVSNRVAVPGPEAVQPGGMTVGIEGALKAHGGVWLGWSGRCSSDDVLPRHRLVRDGVEYVTLDLPAREFEGYYSGFSNQVLWPLLHDRQDLAEFKPSDYLNYLAINERFADELVRILKPDDLVWVHDYHLIPLVHALRQRGVRNRIGFFLHTPFVDVDALNALPVAGAIGADLCAYDLIGFQTAADRRKWRGFLASHTSSARAGHMPLTVPPRCVTLPIGIETGPFAQLAADGRIDDPQLSAAFAQLAHGATPIIAVDRLDYSKGIAERFQAFDAFLNMYPAYEGQVALIQVAPVGRDEIAAYRAEAVRVKRAYAQLTADHPDHRPAYLVTENVDRASLAAVYRRSRVGFVTPLRDGMNLVAKEYVAAQDPNEPGVLILSQFAGAADELDGGALMVDPRNIPQVAGALQQALTMPRHERIRRWQTMIAIVRANDATHWSSRFIQMLMSTKRNPAGTMRELIADRAITSDIGAMRQNSAVPPPASRSWAGS